jgi:hypothetical protein
MSALPAEEEWPSEEAEPQELTMPDGDEFFEDGFEDDVEKEDLYERIERVK